MPAGPRLSTARRPRGPLTPLAWLCLLPGLAAAQDEPIELAPARVIAPR